MLKQCSILCFAIALAGCAGGDFDNNGGGPAGDALAGDPALGDPGNGDTDSGDAGGDSAGVLPPGAFDLVSPNNDSSRQPGMPTFQWSSASGAATYRLEVSAGSTFASTVIDQTLTGTSHTVASALMPLVVYCWRVTATNSGGSRLATNAARRFSVPLSFAAGTRPHGIAVTPNGAQAVVANNVTSGTAIIVDLSTGGIATSVPVGESPRSVAITPDGATAWVANRNTVSVITLASTSGKLGTRINFL